MPPAGRRAKLRKTYILGGPAETLQHLSHIDGQWHLWVYCCEWSLIVDGTELAHNESDDVTMHRALRVLNGRWQWLPISDPVRVST